ncbi:MAG TPA: hypothetical protein VMW10_06355 [Alphaproteobacteria bacterium]|nr:hypothetical protein [Alphaproteobacteria bacterium]
MILRSYFNKSLLFFVFAGLYYQELAVNAASSESNFAKNLFLNSNNPSLGDPTKAAKQGYEPAKKAL